MDLSLRMSMTAGNKVAGEPTIPETAVSGGEPGRVGRTTTTTTTTTIVDGAVVTVVTTVTTVAVTVATIGTLVGGLGAGNVDARDPMIVVGGDERVRRQ